MKNVIETFATLPKLVMGTLTSFLGAVTAPQVPKVQYLVWAASFFAAAATGGLALARIYIEIKKAKKDGVI